MTLSRLRFFHITACLLLILQGSALYAQTELIIPDGYYDKANGLAGAQLKTALHQIIEVGTRVSYGSGTWTAFEKTDRTDDGYVWDMYSFENRTFPGNGNAPSGMNIEHSVAKSWWGGASNDAYRDLYHLNPSDSKANSARSNYPLGVVTNGTTTGSIKVGSNTFGNEYSGNSFEPLDEYKGDFARAYLYMFTCYEDYSWTSTNAPTMIVGNEKYPMLRNWAAEMLVKWCKEDPVSEKERKRATEIYKIQKNRNPFIDYPELVDYLWGDKKGLPFEFIQSDEPRVSSPTNGATYTMEEVSYLSTSTININLKVVNITSPVTISLNGSSANLFELSKETFTPIDGAINDVITVIFYPVEASNESVDLVITSNNNEFTATKATINAVANENFYALEASEVSANSFVANWTPLSTTNRFELDVYTKLVTGSEPIKLAETSFNGGLDSGWSTLTGGYCEYTSEKGSIRLASSSNYGGVVSPSIDLSDGGVIVFNAKSYNTSTVTVTIKVDDVAVTTAEIGVDYAEQSIDLGKHTKSSKVTFHAAKSNRCYVNAMSITTQGEVVELIRHSGFPIEVQNANKYTVTGLSNSTNYFYTVTPLNSTWPKSDEKMVTTNASTGIDNLLDSNINVYYQGGYIYIENCEAGDIVFVYDISGKVVCNEVIQNINHQVKLENSGIYIVKVYSKAKTYSTKIYSSAGLSINSKYKRGLREPARRIN